MQTRNRFCFYDVTALAFIVCLAVLPATRAAACTNKFSNFTTCAFLNGVPADGDLTRIAMTKLIENSMRLEYDADASITKTEKCYLDYSQFRCLASTNSAPTLVNGVTTYTFSAPCASDGTRLKPCYELCRLFYKECYNREDSTTEAACLLTSAPKGETKCFGSNGVLGMKSSASTTAASWVIGPLALAVARLSMSSSF